MNIEIKAALKDKDRSGLAHLTVKKSYGEKTYRAARKIFFGF